MYWMRFYFYAYIIFCLYSTSYGAASDASHQQLDAPTRNLMQRLQNLCTDTVVTSATFAQYKKYVQDLKEHQLTVYPYIITFPTTIITPYREQHYFIRSETRQEHLSPLAFALHKGAVFLGYMLAMAFPHYTTIPDSQGNTPLHYLCRNLERNPNINPLNKISRALIYVCNKQLNIPNELGITPIMLLTKPQLIIALALQGANIHHTNSAGQMALTYDPYPFSDRTTQKITTLVMLGADPAHIRTEDKDHYELTKNNPNDNIKKLIALERKHALHFVASPEKYIIISLRNREEFKKYAILKRKSSTKGS